MKPNFSKNQSRPGAVFMISALMVAMFLVSGCGSDDDPVAPGGGGGGGGIGGSVTATIDGVAFTSIVVQAINNGGVIGVGASDSNVNNAFGFGWVDTGATSYSIGVASATNATVSHLQGSLWQASGPSGNGTITITTKTATRIAGTFSFSLPRVSGTEGPAVLEITNGSFDAEFQ